jgi:serine/threonine-protein kinase
VSTLVLSGSVTGPRRTTGAAGGEAFGHYRLEARLGSGGFGEVWRARDTKLDRVVAVKVLQDRSLDDPRAADRFHREARMAARLRHRNIVRVHTFGEIDGRLFLDMELISGSDLRTVLAAGPLDPPRALRILEQVAAALDAAHAVDGPPENRMVHRDVKPANVLLEPVGDQEQVYLADFGVARAVLGGTSLTGAGEIHGTPAYMAPELWNGTASDHRADIYSLTVMLFELVTGQVPYPGPALEAVIAAHLTAPPPRASAFDPRLPPAFDDVIARGLAKQADDRFDRAGDVAAAARAALTVPGPPAGAGGAAPVGSTPTGFGRTTVAPPVAAIGSASPASIRAVQPAAPPVTPAPAPADASSYLGSRRHFAGLAAVAMLIPVYLLEWLPVDATLPLFVVLLYGLGALVAGLLPRR